MTPGCDDPHHCITCSDEGVEMRVLAVDEARGLALCEAAGGQRSSVEVALVGTVGPGDALLVHAGTALTVLDAEVSA
jgi:hydrogenase assembly chaperone HypC/HupF